MLFRKETRINTDMHAYEHMNGILK